MSTIITRTAKGSELTWAELDGNFTNLNADKLQTNANGILGLGATPSAWNVGNVALELPQFAALAFQGAGGTIAANAYYSSTGWKYQSSNYAAKYDISQSTGGHYWRVAASGVAGNAVTFSDAMTLDASGNLGIGTSSPVWKLDVSTAGTSGARITTAEYGQFSLSDGVRGLYMQNYAGTGVVGTSTNNRLTFATNNTERLTLDTSGNLGLGVTPSAWRAGAKALQVGGFASLNTQQNGTVTLAFGAYESGSNTFSYLTTGDAPTAYSQITGQHRWYNAPSGTAGNAITFTQAMTLDASGNLGIGTSSPGYKLDVVGVINSSNDIISQGPNARFSLYRSSGVNYFDWSSGQDLYFSTQTSSGGAGRATKMVLDASGNLNVGTSGQPRHTFQKDSTTYSFSTYNNHATTPIGLNVYYGACAPNGTGSQFIVCNDTAGIKAEIRSNGGLANFSANNANLSDVRTKKDIQDAPSYLDRICAIPVRTFLYKDQTDNLLNLGVIAQEVEAQCPELVDVSGFGETPDNGIALKAIYQTDLQYALMKCIQEQQALITILTARIAAVEAQRV